MDRMLAAVALIALLGAEEAHTSDFEFGHRPARQALVDSDRANGSQEVSDSLSMAEGLTATGKRVANKLGSGALLGSLSGGILAYLARGGSGGDALGVAGAYAAVYNWWIGYTIGAAVGVTAVDPRDHFMASLAGGVVGAAVGTVPGDVLYGGKSALWPLFICPLVGATIGSELGRRYFEHARFTIGLTPVPGRRPSANITLQF